MVIARSSNGLLNTLLSIEAQLRRTHDKNIIRQMQSELEKSRKANWEQSSLPIRARYHLLYGALLEKRARNNPSDWIDSSTEKLQDSLTEFDVCIHAIRNASWNNEELRQLEQTCTYEAHVVSSVLRVWGEEPHIIFGTDVLSKEQKRKEKNARRYRYMLKSQF